MITAVDKTGKEAKERYLERLRLIREGAHAVDLDPFETPEEKADAIDRMKKDVGYMVKKLLPHFATSESADFQIRLSKKVVKNKKCRILVRWGRGLAKSVWCTLIIPLWLWIRGEDIYMVIVGNNEDKSVDLLADIQAEFEANPVLIHYFGDQKLVGSWEKGFFRTKNNRFRGKALGMGMDARGLRIGAVRPNLIVCDDLEDKDTVKNHKRQDEIVEWIESGLLKTMDGDTRRYLHPNTDHAPRTIQNQLEKRHPKWEVDLVKAYDKKTYKPAWPQKYSDTYYKEIEEEDGVISAHAEYLHEPVVAGKIFTEKLIQWGKPPRLNTFKVIAGHWDVAYSGNSDYNAVSVFGLHGINLWKIKAFCRQCEMEEAVRFMYEFSKSMPDTVIIHWRVEKQFWNKPTQDAITKVRQEYGYMLNLSIVERDRRKKYDRMLTMYPYYQWGQIYNNEAERANNDMQENIKQLKGIEPGYSGHDDGPDADHQIIEYLAAFITYQTEGSGNDSSIESGGRYRNNKM